MANQVETVSRVIAPSYNFTRPSDTTAYANGDLVANNTSAASVVPMTWDIGAAESNAAKSFYIAGVRLKLDKNSVTNAQFRVHLYKAAPTFTSAGDNSAYGTVVATGYGDWLGSFDATLVALHADGAVGIAVPTEGLVAPQLMTSQVVGSPVRVYGLIEALAAYTPKSAGVVTAELLLELN